MKKLLVAIVLSALPLGAQTKFDLTQQVKNKLPVANGGTAAGAFTQGSVVFAGASGVYTEDNAVLFWDDSANELGIRTATPANPLHILMSGGAQSQAAAVQTIALFQNTGSIARVSITANATAQSILQLGDEADDDIGAISYNNNTDSFSVRTNNVSDRLVVDSAGDVGIGTATADQDLHVVESTDGASVLLLLENSIASSAASLNETAEIRFAFGGNNDVARISAGKEDDYDPGPTEDDSFMAFSTDRSGTATEVMRLTSAGALALTGRALASLPAAADGSIMYCTDCLKAADPCTSSSTGAMAMRVNGAWQCM